MKKFEFYFKNMIKKMKISKIHNFIQRKSITIHLSTDIVKEF